MSLEKKHVGYWLGQFHFAVRDGKMTPQIFVKIEDAIINGYPKQESSYPILSDSWQKIETAPKDEYIYIWNGETRGEAKCWTYQRAEPRWSWVNALPVDPRPTHWMPLPPIPKDIK